MVIYVLLFLRLKNTKKPQLFFYLYLRFLFSYSILFL